VLTVISAGLQGQDGHKESMAKLLGLFHGLDIARQAACEGQSGSQWHHDAPELPLSRSRADGQLHTNETVASAAFQPASQPNVLPRPGATV